MTAADGSTEPDQGWRGAWPDALAFGLGLGLAWRFQWETRDLVWSLWLSSFVIGYAMIVWGIFGPGMLIVRGVWRDRGELAATPKLPAAAGAAILFTGGLFLLAFFTVHFGMFHFVHSVFLNSFFPIQPEVKHSFPGPALYWEVLKRYWWFLPAAAIAERSAFRLPADKPAPDDTAVTTEAIAARKARNAGFGAGGMMAPYKNVVRMHLLIFFFAFAHFARIDHFAVYAVVYAVYFFPWRLLKREKI